MRLNKEMKMEIQDSLLARRFGKDRERLEARVKRFAQRVYNRAFTSVERRKMEDLPRGWLRVLEHVKFSDTDIEWISVRGQGYRVPEYRTGACLLLLGDHQDLLDIWRKYKRDKQEFDKALKAAGREIRTVLESVGSTRRLKETWPEITDLVDELAPPAPSRALAVRTEKVNALLGLVG